MSDLEERLKEEMELDGNISGDGVWSTAPSTPTSHRKDDPKANGSGGNHEKAGHMGGGGGEGAGDRHGPLPPMHISSNQTPKDQIHQQQLQQGNGGGSGVTPPEVVSSSVPPSRIHRGFMPPNIENFDATKSTDLPGARWGESPVITTPPHSQTNKTGHTGSDVVIVGSRQRAKSIEDVDKQRGGYVPSREGTEEGFDEAPRSFCLGLSSLISPQDSDEKIRADLEEKSNLLATSTISLPGSFQDPSSIENDGGITEDYYALLMNSSTCYDIIPSSTKIVVFDTSLRVKKAFFALVANGLRAAPLWDSARQAFVGMLTITDFINILRHHYKSPIVGMDELENQTIQEWRASEKKVASVKLTLLQIDPMQSLYEAVKMLVEYKIHRLPVIDSQTGNALFILTHKKLLNFLYCQICLENQQPSYMQKSLKELGIGTYKNIATASPNTPIITALNIFHERRVSALPIIDASGKVVDIYAKFDVINLAAERIYNNLDVSLSQALLHRSQGFEGVQSCLSSESLFTIIQRLGTTKVHRLVMVNHQQHVVGVVSLSDVLKFLVITSHV